MALYPVSISDRMEPLEQEESEREVMEGCTHCDACERAYFKEHTLNDPDLIARWLDCYDCEEWE